MHNRNSFSRKSILSSMEYRNLPNYLLPSSTLREVPRYFVKMFHQLFFFIFSYKILYYFYTWKSAIRSSQSLTQLHINIKIHTDKKRWGLDCHTKILAITAELLTWLSHQHGLGGLSSCLPPSLARQDHTLDNIHRTFPEIIRSSITHFWYLIVSFSFY